jgi:nicotinamide riboside kinase
MKSIVVNCIGGPGVGKSFLAMEITIALKRVGIQCELAEEYAKRLVWEGDRQTLADQSKVFSGQEHLIELFRDKVEIIVTDSPLILSCIYNADKTSLDFKRMVMEQFNSYHNLTYFVQRSLPFDPSGRIHNLEESKAIDGEIERLLIEQEIPFQQVFPGEYSLDIIVNEILMYKKELIKKEVGLNNA